MPAAIPAAVAVGTFLAENAAVIGSVAGAVGTAASSISGHQDAVKQAQAQKVAANAAIKAVPTTTSPDVQNMAADARRRAAMARGAASTNIVGGSGMGGTKLGQVGL